MCQDAIHGCGDNRLLDDGARIGQLMNENKLYKALGMFDERLASIGSHLPHEIVKYQKGISDLKQFKSEHLNVSFVVS